MNALLSRPPTGRGPWCPALAALPLAGCATPPEADLSSLVEEVPWDELGDAFDPEDVDAYLTLPERMPEVTRPVDPDALRALLLEQYDYEGPLRDTPSPDALSDVIRSAVHAGPLLDRLDTEPLLWAEAPAGDLARDVGWDPVERVVLQDEAVGRFEVVLLLPEGEGPFPAVVLAHGHQEDATSFLVNRFGWELAEAGFVVAAPTLRANDAEDIESAVSWRLLEAGATFMGVRVYEHLLVAKLLAARPEVEGPVGLVGHSGGAVTANLTARLRHPDDGGVDALVSDFTSPYLSVDWELDRIFDDTAPDLFDWSNAVADLDAAWQPALALDYGFPEGVDSIIDFLDATLR